MPNACNVPSRTIFTGDNLDILARDQLRVC